MSIEQVSLALNTVGLDPTTKLVLVGLANHSHRDGSNAFPTKATLAEYAGIVPRSVQRHLRVLRDLGLIEEERAAYRGHATAYRLRLSGDNVSPEGVKPASPEAEPKGDTGEPLGRHPAPVGETPVTVWGDTRVTHNRNEPSLNRQEPSSAPTALVSAYAYSPDFEEFWKIYPIHEGKGAASKAYIKARKRASRQEILDGVERYRAVLAANPDRKVKWAQGWLNECRWEDEPVAATTQKPSRHANIRALADRLEAQGL